MFPIGKAYANEDSPPTFHLVKKGLVSQVLLSSTRKVQKLLNQKSLKLKTPWIVLLDFMFMPPMSGVSKVMEKLFQ